MIGGGKHIETVDAVDYVIEPYDWPFLTGYAEKIDAHWTELCARKPRLFNGRVMMMNGYRIENGVLRGTGFETDYKAYLAWRDLGFPDKNAINCFSMAAVRSSDGAFMLGRMGEHTAAAKQLYFPAGTPDLNDVKNGRIDLYGSALRELTEETGLSAEDLSISPQWTIVLDGQRLACMKPARAHLDAAALVARCKAFLAQDKDPELDDVVPIFSPADFDKHHMPVFMQDYMRSQF